jgi:hypothetical protein
MTPRARKATPEPEPEAPSHRELSLESAIEALEAAFVQCRDFGHSWRPWRTSWSPRFNSYENQLRCTRCKTLRVRLIGRRGQIVSSHYEYPDGYQFRGLGHLSSGDRDHIRLASMIHLSPQQLPAEAEDA